MGPTPAAAKLWCDGIPVGDAAAWCDWVAREPVGKRRDGVRLALIDRPDEESLRRMLLAPVDAIVEVEGTQPERETSELPEDGAFCLLSLTTASAYRLFVARAFSLGLAQRTETSNAVRANIETALQEVIANAVIHGNLGIAMTPGTSIGAVAELDDLTRRRLGDPVLAARRVRILASWTKDRIEIRVRDEGQGYSLEAARIAAERQPEDAFSGRGLKVIGRLATSYSVESGGTCFVMAFRR